MADDEQAKVHLVNRALIKIGNAPSYSIDAETDLGAIVDLVWPGVEAHVATLYDWSFFRATRALEPLASFAANGWAYGFALPADRAGEPLAFLQQVAPREMLLREFMIEQGNVYAHVTPLWARIRLLADPSTWDIGFQEGFVTALAAAFAVPLNADEDLEAKLYEMAFGSPRENGSGGIFGRLIALNRAAQPQGRGFMDNDPLTRARFG